MTKSKNVHWLSIPFLYGNSAIDHVSNPSKTPTINALPIPSPSIILSLKKEKNKKNKNQQKNRENKK